MANSVLPFHRSAATSTPSSTQSSLGSVLASPHLVGVDPTLLSFAQLAALNQVIARFLKLAGHSPDAINVVLRIADHTLRWFGA